MKTHYWLKGVWILLLLGWTQKQACAQADTAVATSPAAIAKSKDSLQSATFYLLSFTGAYSSGQTVLTWKTDSRSAFSSFTLERGADENHFSAVGEVAVQSGSNTNSFTYADTRPLTGRSLYRLKMKDTDGHTTYSAVVAVRYLPVSNLQIHYDAASGTVGFAGMEGGGQYQVKVYSSNGQPVLQKTVSTTATSISISSLLHGLYVVHITDGAVTTASQKIIW